MKIYYTSITMKAIGVYNSFQIKLNNHFYLSFSYNMMTKPTKQKHSIAGHIYNNVCSRSCYKINGVHKWTFCECMAKNKKK